MLRSLKYSTVSILGAISIVSVFACNTYDPQKTAITDVEGSRLATENNHKVGNYLTSAQLSDGRIILAYFNDTLGGLEVAIQKAANTDTFDFHRVIGDGQDIGVIGRYNDIVVTPKNEIVISTYDKTFGELILVRGTDTGFEKPTKITQSGHHKVGLWTSLALAENGNLHTAFYDKRGDLYYGVHDLQASEWQYWNVTETIDVASGAPNPIWTLRDFGRSAQVAVKKNGEAYIACYDASYGDLYLVTVGKSPEDGMPAFKLTLIDSDGDVGSSIWLGLDKNEQPVIAYYDSSNGQLRAAVGANHDLVVLDEEGNVGMDVRCYIDSQNNLHAAYLDVAKFDLRRLVYNIASRQVTSKENVATRGVTGFWPVIEATDTGDVIYYQLVRYRDPKTGNQVLDEIRKWPA